jgi:hypothetical protein
LHVEFIQIFKQKPITPFAGVERQNVPVDFVGVFRSIETVLLECVVDESQLIFWVFAADLSLFQRRFRERDPTDFFGFSRRSFTASPQGLLDSLSQLILSGFSAATRPPCSG